MNTLKIKEQKQIREEIWRGDFEKDATYIPQLNKYAIRSNGILISDYDTANLWDKYKKLREKSRN